MANTARITQSALELFATQNGTARITQSVIEFLVGLGIDCGGPPNGFLGTAYSHAFPAGAGTPPYMFSIIGGALPTGLSLDAATGIVSGIPGAVGIFNFTIQVTDVNLSTASVVCSITILAGQKVSIVLYGWKLYPEGTCENPEEVAPVPPVYRAV